MSVSESLKLIAEKAVHEAGLNLYDIEYVPNKKFLRLYIIDEATKSAVIEDCVKVDEIITPLLDSNSQIPQGLTLEVSSPGLYRDLKLRKHFEWSKGLRIKIYNDSNTNLLNKKGKKRLEVVGILKDVLDDANGFALEIIPEGESECIFVTSNIIKKAQTDPKI